MKTLYTTAANQDSKYVYPCHGDHSIQSALTIAVLMAMGAIKLSKAGTVSRTDKAINLKVLRKLIGKPSTYVANLILDKKGKVTVHGVNRLSDRLNGTAPAFRTTKDLVHTMYGLVTKGGEKKINEVTVKFHHAIKF